VDRSVQAGTVAEARAWRWFEQVSRRHDKLELQSLFWYSEGLLLQLLHGYLWQHERGVLTEVEMTRIAGLRL